MHTKSLNNCHEVEMHIQYKFKQGIIEPSHCPMASFLVYVLKGKNGKDGVRLAADVGYVNKPTAGDAFPVPNIAESSSVLAVSVGSQLMTQRQAIGRPR